MEQRCGDNYLPVSPMPLLQYWTYMMYANPNIMFFPLSDTVMNRGKSNISFLESSYFGAAYFGNVSLPEFSGITLKGMKEFYNGDWDIKSLEIANQLSWEYICDELLLSNINKIRTERLLSI